MQHSRFQALVEYLLDNLFDICTIVIAGFLVIRHQVQPFAPTEFGELATWMLAVLGLIAVSGLWDRNRRLYRIEKLSQESRDLVLRRISGKVRSGDFFLSERPISDKTFASAKTIWIAGMTLTRTTREYVHILRERLVSGASIRIIILDASETLLQELTLRSMGDTTVDFWRQRLQTVETLVRGVIAKTPGSTGKVELGRLPFIPSFGFIIIDPDEKFGSCFAEIYDHKSFEPNPIFELRASDDPYWYGRFRQQFEIMWKSCRVELLH